jgi:hypothetical protein
MSNGPVFSISRTDKPAQESENPNTPLKISDQNLDTTIENVKTLHVIDEVHSE